jgi:hypothetical protein
VASSTSVLVEADHLAPRANGDPRALTVSKISAPLLDAIVRFVRLVDTPRDYKILSACWLTATCSVLYGDPSRWIREKNVELVQRVRSVHQYHFLTPPTDNRRSSRLGYRCRSINVRRLPVSIRRSAFSLLIPTFVVALLVAAPAPAAAQQPLTGYSAIADFTGDGRADIADHWGANGSFWIRRNYGNGTFEAPGTFWGSGTASAPLSVNGTNDWTIFTGDFTGDGWADYADYHQPSGQIWIHENLHDGTFGGTWGYADLSAGHFLMAGDIDGDGRTDLFDYYDDIYRYFPNLGAGTTFTQASVVMWFQSTGHLTNTSRVSLADFNGDNCDDIIFSNVGTNGWFDVYKNNCINLPGQRGFSTTVSWSGQGVGHPVIEQVFGDFNADGLADYADVNKDTGEIWWHANLGPGSGFNPAHTAYGLYSSAAGFSILGFPVFFF